MTYRIINSAAQSKATVFITGESGTGKELCADAVHKQSPRRNGPFIVINCAAIPRELMESEVFGHVKGAFTGATSNRDGAAALADGGTLFFDEICELDAALQIDSGCIDATVAKAMIHERQARYDDARVLLEEQLDEGRTDPGIAAIYMRIIARDGDHDAVIRLGTAVTGAGNSPTMWLRDVYFALARSYEARSDWADALDSGGRANAIATAPFDPEVLRQWVDAIIETFSPAMVRSWARVFVSTLTSTYFFSHEMLASMWLLQS